MTISAVGSRDRIQPPIDLAPAGPVETALTEVPEHLLKRAAAARAKATGEPAPDVAPTETANAPAVVDSAAAAAAPSAGAPVPIPEGAPPEPPKPEAPWVTAANDRQKIPAWVMPVLLFLPIWAFMYVGTLEDPPREEPVLALGGEIYAEKCASCHGGEGGGGIGPAFSNGALIESFPDFADQIEWVAKGTAGFEAEGRETYGAGVVVGGSGAQMPAFGDDLSAEELMAVIFYERVDLSDHEEDLDLARALYEAFEGGDIAAEQWPEAVTLGQINADLAGVTAEFSTEAAAG